VRGFEDHPAGAQCTDVVSERHPEGVDLGDGAADERFDASELDGFVGEWLVLFAGLSRLLQRLEQRGVDRAVNGVTTLIDAPTSFASLAAAASAARPPAEKSKPTAISLILVSIS